MHPTAVRICSACLILLIHYAGCLLHLLLTKLLSHLIHLHSLPVIDVDGVAVVSLHSVRRCVSNYRSIFGFQQLATPQVRKGTRIGLHSTLWDAMPLKGSLSRSPPPLRKGRGWQQPPTEYLCQRSSQRRTRAPIQAPSNTTLMLLVELKGVCVLGVGWGWRGVL